MFQKSGNPLLNHALWAVSNIAGRDELNTCVPHGEPMWPDMTGKRQEQTAAHKTDLDTALEAAWTVGSKWWKNNSFIVTMSIVLFVYPVGSQWWTTATRIGVSNLWLKNCILTYQNFGPCMYVCTLWFLVFSGRFATLPYLFMWKYDTFSPLHFEWLWQTLNITPQKCDACLLRSRHLPTACAKSLEKKRRPHRSFQQHTCLDTGWEQMWFHIHVWEIRCMSK